MAGSYDAVTARYVGVDGAASFMDYPSTGWSFFCMFYPDSGITSNSFAYLWSHEEPLNFQHAVNILKQSPGGEIRVIVDIPAGNVVDLVSSNSVVADQWNAVAVIWDSAGTMRIWLNGTETTQVTAPFGTVSPGVEGRIGYANHGGSRQWNGRICHAAKYSREFTQDEAEKYTQVLVSPQFAQNSADWHVEMFRGGSMLFDLVGNATVSETLMAYGPHAQAMYPEDDFDPGALVIPPTPGGGLVLPGRHSFGG